MFGKQSLIDLGIVLAIPLVLIGGVTFFGGTNDVSLISEQPSAAIGPNDPGAKTKLALDTLSGISLSDALFKDEAYTTLVPYSAPIPPVPLSRDNPFIPPPVIEELLRQARLGNDVSKSKLTPVNSVNTQNLSSKLDALKKSLGGK